MKRAKARSWATICALAFATLITTSIQPAAAAETLTLVAEDSFEYTGNMVGKNGGSGFAGAWAFDYGTSDYGTNSSGLTYSGLTTAGGYMYGCSSTPNQVCGIKREIPVQSSGVTFIQFLANFGAQTGGGTPMIRLFDASGSLTGGIGANGGTYGSKISILDSTGNPPSDGSASAGTLNSNTFVVVKIDYTNNKTSMWLNPDLATFSYLNPPTPTVFLNGLAPVVKNIAFYSRVGYSKFDELKVYKITGTSSGDADAAAEAERKRAEAERAAAVKAARERLNLLLATNQEITTKDLSDADSPIKSVNSLLLAYKELLSIKYALTRPLSAEEAYALKFSKFMKYAMYERLTGISSGDVTGRDLVKFGVIAENAPMKQLTTYQLLKQPLSARDSISKVDQFFAVANAKFLARKEHLTNTIARIHSR